MTTKLQDLFEKRKKKSQHAMHVESAIELAERVLVAKRDLFRSSSVLNNASVYLPEINNWYRLTSLVRRPSIDATAQALREVTANWLRSAASTTLGYALVRHGEEVHVLFGGSREIQSALHNRFPDAKLEECSSAPLCTPYKFNGALVGSTLDLSLIADSCALKDSYVACVSEPFLNAQWQNILETDRANIEILRPFLSTREFAGSDRAVDIDVPRIREAKSILEREVEYLEGHDGYARSVVRFGAQSREEFEILRALLDGCIQHREGKPTSAIDGIYFYTITGALDPLAVPLLVNPSSYLSNIQGHARAIQAIDDALSVTCTPPLTGHPGYSVYSFGNSENNGDVFQMIPDLKGIPIGSIEGTSSYRMSIPLEKLMTHACIFGGTGTGKSSTIRSLLIQLHQCGIPFLVVESAKKEYCPSMIGSIQELKVYGSGLDCHPLRLNPFQPEDGTMIATQIADLSHALYAMSGGESPLPQAIRLCVQLCYLRRGWNLNEVAYADPKRPWPNYDDLMATIPEVTKRYAPEVRMNLSAALTLRFEAISQGLAHGCEGMCMEELLSRPTIIELADYSAEFSVFIAMMLLKHIQAYLTRQPPSDQLRGVCILEESHNLFQKTSNEGGIQNLTNLLLEKLLAEARTSGYSFILSEQRPSLLSDAVLANCGLRIAHALSSGTDLKLFADSIGLTDEQAARVRYFEPGEAVVSLAALPLPPQHVRMTLSPVDSTYTAGCVVCNDRFRCHKVRVMGILSAADPELLKLRAKQLAASPFNPERVKSVARLFIEDDLHAAAESPAVKICILGAMLRKGGISFDISRLILRSYERNLMKGE